MSTLKVAFDLHGVITSNPKDYKTRMGRLISQGHEIWVISGPPSHQVKKELSELGLVEGEHYHNIVGVVDYLLDNNHPHKIDEAGNYWFDKVTWWSSKSEICENNNIHILFDNDKKYQDYFSQGHPTIFVLIE